MSIIVKGMEMPENCGECYLSARTSLPSGVVTRCRLGGVVGTPIEESNKRHPDCPLVALPDHHGRLVDADALEPDADYYDGDYYAYSVAQVCNAPTIVEAEKTP